MVMARGAGLGPHRATRQLLGYAPLPQKRGADRSRCSAGSRCDGYCGGRTVSGPARGWQRHPLGGAGGRGHRNGRQRQWVVLHAHGQMHPIRTSHDLYADDVLKDSKGENRIRFIRNSCRVVEQRGFS